MKMQFKMPSITAPSIPGQIQQIHSYLRQLAGDLQMAFSGSEESGNVPFAVTPCNNGIAVRGQSCRFYGGLKLVQGQATVTISGKTIAEGVFMPVVQIPKAYVPARTVAASAVMPGVGLCNCYIQGRNTQAPGMVFLACDRGSTTGTVHEATVSFVYQKEE